MGQEKCPPYYNQKMFNTIVRLNLKPETHTHRAQGVHKPNCVLWLPVFTKMSQPDALTDEFR